MIPRDRRQDEDVPSGLAHHIRTARMEAFSDGVFAIAITLLVLELGVPDGSADDLLGAVLAQWPSFLAYVVSFATIGAVWLSHTAITEHLDRVDATFVRLNLLLLLVVSFIPFPTRLLAEHIAEQNAERVATALYGLTLLLASVLIAVLWRHAVRAGLVRAESTDEEVDILTKRLTPGLVGYLVIIAIGLAFPLAAIFGYGVIAFFFLVPLPGGRSGR
jgi:TMEM175 potassium channel family protein